MDKKFALVGNPNSGKTTLFNLLTKSTAHVGNWPGVTVEKKTGIYKNKNTRIEIIDLPGIYSLSPYTSEEIISRNYILEEKVDCIINIVDATNIERNLYLTTQLLEMDVPVIIALNMMDVLEKNGKQIDVNAIKKQFDVEIVEISALKNKNTDKLIAKAIIESEKKRQAKNLFNDSEIGVLINSISNEFISQEINNPLFLAMKIIENDEIVNTKYPEIKKSFDLKRKKDFDYEAYISNERYKYISKISTVHEDLGKNSQETRSDKADKILTSKFFGIPIFLLILFLVFHITFSENLFFMSSLLQNAPVNFEGSIFEGLFYSSNGINSLGVVLQSFLTNITDFVQSSVRTSLEFAPEWVGGFIGDGVLGGLFAVLSFLPQILLLFLFFSLLEDSGYMARVAFMLDRIFRKFGISGRAFMPMIMGFGCSVPAMINTRTLADEKEKIATIRVIPFFSCGAKLPILTAISGGIIMYFNVGNADLITYGMYLLGMITALLSIVVMKQTTLRGETAPFIMELPSYHLPQFKSLMIHLWDKTKSFIKKAFTIILLSTIVIWVISHFSFDWKYLPDDLMNESILAGFGKLISPLFTPLGFGSQLSSFGWVFAVAAITGLIAKENVIATFGTLAACIIGSMIDVEADGGIAAVTALIEATNITIPGLIAFIAFNMLTIPCFAAVATAKAELSKKNFAPTILFWMITSYVVSMMIYLCGTYPWTASIFVVIFIIFFAYVYFRNKKEKQLTLGE